MQNVPHRIKAGDIIQMGYRRRTLKEWLLRKPKEPQLWRVSFATGEAGQFSPITPIENKDLNEANNAV